MRRNKLAFTITEAAEATGFSADTIRRAVQAGDLPVRKPKINGKQVKRPVILASDIEAWLSDK